MFKHPVRHVPYTLRYREQGEPGGSSSLENNTSPIYINETAVKRWRIIQCKNMQTFYFAVWLHHFLRGDCHVTCVKNLCDACSVEWNNMIQMHIYPSYVFEDIMQPPIKLSAFLVHVLTTIEWLCTRVILSLVFIPLHLTCTLLMSDSIQIVSPPVVLCAALSRWRI